MNHKQAQLLFTEYEYRKQALLDFLLFSHDNFYSPMITYISAWVFLFKISSSPVGHFRSHRGEAQFTLEYYSEAVEGTQMALTLELGKKEQISSGQSSQ